MNPRQAMNLCPFFKHALDIDRLVLYHCRTGHAESVKKTPVCERHAKTFTYKMFGCHYQDLRMLLYTACSALALFI